ncbi:protein prenyltransferase alpha subunit repeat-containing protein 1 [Colletotrichum spaethianum]|uniref:Protein prenyltransferase alpha subunit repeat-containing protein 1 n=1 Tax=Colletotrichum spaethianum TaxID=700344 RepID=A0AA37LEW0_9PEZI|nr:protein prenyltransferase alpha subunit repeat-containing protein 1 [Colletotrichum spaethianum]GKT47173.1 protein prenyltransferase alpha subunit repeat-containing protein 1 [Colletotrichum spaethianum]
MSRALDKHVIAALKKGDHQKIFDDISSLFKQQEDDRRLEIEILGQSHPLGPDEHLLRDENAVAIPKLRIVQAFLFARQIFEKHLAGDPIGVELLLAATSVMLLMDPEHLTATNTRKRLLRDAISAGDDVHGRLAKERWFVDSLLTSRLHRHTKSPTLWSHRRWLMGQYRHAGLPVAVQQDIESIVMVAGERHPRNYYAWTHARWLTRMFLVDAEPGVLPSLVQSVKRWSFRHHVDVSGWSFLAHLMERLDDCGEQTSLSVFEETLRLTESLRWCNESVWWFLRTIVSRPAMGQASREKLASIQRKLMDVNVDDSTEAKVLKTAQKWCESFGPRGDATFSGALG